MALTLSAGRGSLGSGRGGLSLSGGRGTGRLGSVGVYSGGGLLSPEQIRRNQALYRLGLPIGKPAGGGILGAAARDFAGLVTGVPSLAVLVGRGAFNFNPVSLAFSTAGRLGAPDPVSQFFRRQQNALGGDLATAGSAILDDYLYRFGPLNPFGGEGVGEFASRALEHPLYTALDVAGLYGGIGRAAGLGARLGARALPGESTLARQLAYLGDRDPLGARRQRAPRLVYPPYTDVAQTRGGISPIAIPRQPRSINPVTSALQRRIDALLERTNDFYGTRNRLNAVPLVGQRARYGAAAAAEGMDIRIAGADIARASFHAYMADYSKLARRLGPARRKLFGRAGWEQAFALHTLDMLRKTPDRPDPGGILDDLLEFWGTGIAREGGKGRKVTKSEEDLGRFAKLRDKHPELLDMDDPAFPPKLAEIIHEARARAGDVERMVVDAKAVSQAAADFARVRKGRAAYGRSTYEPDLIRLDDPVEIEGGTFTVRELEDELVNLMAARRQARQPAPRAEAFKRMQEAERNARDAVREATTGSARSARTRVAAARRALDELAEASEASLGTGRLGRMVDERQVGRARTPDEVRALADDLEAQAAALEARIEPALEEASIAFGRGQMVRRGEGGRAGFQFEVRSREAALRDFLEEAGEGRLSRPTAAPGAYLRGTEELVRPIRGPRPRARKPDPDQPWEEFAQEVIASIREGPPAAVSAAERIAARDAEVLDIRAKAANLRLREAGRRKLAQRLADELEWDLVALRGVYDDALRDIQAAATGSKLDQRVAARWAEIVEDAIAEALEVRIGSAPAALREPLERMIAALRAEGQPFALREGYAIREPADVAAMHEQATALREQARLVREAADHEQGIRDFEAKLGDSDDSAQMLTDLYEAIRAEHPVTHVERIDYRARRRRAAQEPGPRPPIPEEVKARGRRQARRMLSPGAELPRSRRGTAPTTFPRIADGKFTGDTLYHITPRANLDSILAEGLRQSDVDATNVWFYSTYEDAFADVGKPWGGSRDNVILAVDGRGLRVIPDPHGYPNAYVVQEAIPAGRIRGETTAAEAASEAAPAGPRLTPREQALNEIERGEFAILAGGSDLIPAELARAISADLAEVWHDLGVARASLKSDQRFRDALDREIKLVRRQLKQARKTASGGWTTPRGLEAINSTIPQTAEMVEVAAKLQQARAVLDEVRLALEEAVGLEDAARAAQLQRRLGYWEKRVRQNELAYREMEAAEGARLYGAFEDIEGVYWPDRPKPGQELAPAGGPKGGPPRPLNRMTADDVYQNRGTQFGYLGSELSKRIPLIAMRGAIRAIHHPDMVLELLERTALRHAEGFSDDLGVVREGGDLIRGEEAVRLAQRSPKDYRLVHIPTMRDTLAKMQDMPPGEWAPQSVLEAVFARGEDVGAARRADVDEGAAAEREAALGQGEPGDVIEGVIEPGAQDVRDFLRSRDWRADDVLVIPARTAEEFLDAGRGYFRAYDTALGVWKAGVLVFTPRWYVYNLLGNTMQYGLLSGGDLRSIFLAAGPGRWLRPTSAGRAQARARHERIKEITPEEMRSTAQAHELGVREGLAKLGSVAQRAFSFNERLEGFLRTAAYLNVAKRNLRYRGQGAAARNPLFGGDTDELIRAIDEAPLPLKDEVIRESLLFMGDYRRFNRFERSVMRRVFPFFSWIRVITRLTLTLPIKSPMRAAALSLATQLAREAGDPIEAALDEARPLWARGAISLPGGIPVVGGLQIRTFGLNPFATTLTFVPQLLQGDLTGAARGLAPSLAPGVGGAAEALLPGAKLFGGREVTAPPGYGGLIRSFGGGYMAPSAITGGYEPVAGPSVGLGESILQSILPHVGSTLRSFLAGPRRVYDTTTTADLLRYRLGLGGAPQESLFRYNDPRYPRISDPASFPAGFLSGLSGLPLQTYDRRAEIASRINDLQRELEAARQTATQRARLQARFR